MFLKKQKNSGRHAFENVNAWILLTDVLTSVLKDPLIRTTYLLVDALDECVIDRPKLLGFLSGVSSATSQVKWIVSSRNWPSIHTRLNDKIGLSLELNATCIERAVKAFIEYKVAYLAIKHRYDEALEAAMLEYVLATSQNTFLWVALVVLNLEDVPQRHALRKLKAMPAGLNALYQRMLEQIDSTDDAETCKQILAIATAVFRPVTILELEALLPHDMSVSLAELTEMVGLCGSFLTLRDDTVFFVHQSAADYVLDVATDTIYPLGRNAIHGVILHQSLQALTALRRDMYSLKDPGCMVQNAVTPNPDPLSKLRYACVYWMDHLAEIQDSGILSADLLSDGGIVFAFIHEKFVYWLESLSLCLSVPKGLVSITKLAKRVQDQAAGPTLSDFVLDAKRFMQYHQDIIMAYPLQAYTSALLFSRTQSLIRQSFQNELPSWVSVSREMENTWTACVRVFEEHSHSVDYVESVHFSDDSSLLVSTAKRVSTTEVMIRNTVSGQILQRLEFENQAKIAVSDDGHRLAVLFPDLEVEIWDTLEAALVSRLRYTDLRLIQDSYQISRRNSIAISPDSNFVAAKGKNTIVIWKTNMLDSLHTLRTQGSFIVSTAFSEDNRRLCAVMGDGAILRWDVLGGDCLSVLEGGLAEVTSAALHGDEQCLCLTENPYGILSCNTQSGQASRLSEDYATIIAIDSKLTKYASVGRRMVSIWDIASRIRLREFTWRSDYVCSVAFSPDSSYIAFGFYSGDIHVYDLTVKEASQVCQDYEDITSMCWSPDSSHLVVISPSGSADLWDAHTGQRDNFITHEGTITCGTFSQSQPVRLATGSCDQVIKLWDLSKHVCVLELRGHQSSISSIAFSADSNQLVTTSVDAEVKIWNLLTGQCTSSFGYDSQSERKAGEIQATFSNDSKRVLVACDSVRIWDVDTTLSHQDYPELGGLQEPFHQTSIALAPDNASLAKPTFDDITIWDLAQRQAPVKLPCDMPAASLAFDTTGLYLDSSLGTIDIAATIAQSRYGVRTPVDSVYRGLSLNYSGDITYNSRLLLCIPAEYRAGWNFFAVHNNAVAIIDRARRLWMYKFDLDKIKALVTRTDSG